MTITAEIQKLEPGELITLFECDGTAIGAGVLRFHSHLQAGPIWWQGVEYSPWAVEADGFALTSDKPPSPRITLANVDRSVTVMCQHFDDLVGAKVIRRRTLGRFLDAANFVDGNPTADPGEHLPDEIWFVERKVSETKDAVQFELTSAMDLAGIRLPRRQMIANQCSWAYRSAECGYTGNAVAKADGTPTTDPQLDRCGKRVEDCKLRFGETSNLPYGGFPACGMTRM